MLQNAGNTQYKRLPWNTTQANSLSCPFFFLPIPRLTQLNQSENPIPQPPPPAVSASGPRCWNAPPPFAAAAGPAPFGRQRCRKCHATCRGLEGFGGEGIESIEVVGNGIYWGVWCTSLPIGSMYGIYANIWGILMVNVTIYSIHGSYGLYIWYIKLINCQDCQGGIGTWSEWSWPAWQCEHLSPQ